jgi:pyruvate dehydrogenase E2 component (dihydrolipoamide acetyltransferase)
MISKIVMPQGGQTTETSLVSAWMVKVGDTVKRGDILLEVETDKAILAVESYAAGIVMDILVPAGAEASEGEVLALVGSEQDWEEYKANKNAPAAPQAQAVSSDDEEDEYQPIIKAQSQSKPVEAADKKTGGYPAMPNAKKEAKERGIDISKIIPANGAIIKRSDVLALANLTSELQSSQQTDADVEIVPLSRMRKTIAARMLESVSTIPTYQETVLVDMRAAIALREQLKQKVKVSYNDIIARCLCAAIKDHKLINASYTDEAIKVYKHVNIGVAVSVDDGLVVPVVKNAEQMNLAEIAQKSAALVAAARDGALKQDDMTGGTITLSNLGMYAVDHFTAIVNPPESCILAIGKIQERSVYEESQWKSVPVAAITASFDHRIIDGAYGAAFLTDLKTLIENPSLAL